MEAIKSIKIDNGTIFQIVPMSISDVIKTSAKLVKPLTPLFGLLSKVKKPKDGEKKEELDDKEIASAIMNAMNYLDGDDIDWIAYTVLKGGSVLVPGYANQPILKYEDFSQLIGIRIDDIIVLLLEAMKFNEFPFLRKVEIDFSTLITKMTSINLEDLDKS